jgi:hypothetical protein
MIQKTLTMPAGTTDEQMQWLKDAISSWHIVYTINLSGRVLVWKQPQGFGHGAESLNDYIEGLSTGLRIANPKKTLKIETEVLP